MAWNFQPESPGVQSKEDYLNSQLVKLISAVKRLRCLFVFVNHPSEIIPIRETNKIEN